MADVCYRALDRQGPEGDRDDAKVLEIARKAGVAAGHFDRAELSDVDLCRGDAGVRAHKNVGESIRIGAFDEERAADADMRGVSERDEAVALEVSIVLHDQFGSVG